VSVSRVTDARCRRCLQAMTCAPPPPIGTMLCSKEPPPSRPTPQPSEGCFQFETDYAGNVGNDMGVPTAGYRAGRFNLPEWQEATYAKYYQSFADRDNAERLRNVSTDMIKETTALARLTQVTIHIYVRIYISREAYPRRNAYRSRRSVCLSVPRRIPTLLHGPGCNLGME